MDPTVPARLGPGVGDIEQDRDDQSAPGCKVIHLFSLGFRAVAPAVVQTHPSARMRYGAQRHGHDLHRLKLALGGRLEVDDGDLLGMGPPCNTGPAIVPDQRVVRVEFLHRRVDVLDRA